MDSFVPDQGIKDSQKPVWLIHKARKGEFTQAVRDKMEENSSKPGRFEMLQKLFEESDADKDGFLNEDEFIVFRKGVTDFQAQMNGEGVVLPEDVDRSIYKISVEYFGTPGLNMEQLGKTLKTFGTFAMKPESKYRIWYFEGLYGRAEPIRQLLTHAGVAFEDMGIHFINQWPMIKSSIPGGTLPLIEMQNGVLKGGATRATMRYLAHIYGYQPEDPMQAQQCDMIIDAYQDPLNQGGNAAFGRGLDPATIPEEIPKFHDKLHAFLKFLEPYCAKGQFLCGPKLCTADFWVGHTIFAHFENPGVLFGRDEGENSWTNIYAKYPAFKAYVGRYKAANAKRFAQLTAAPF